MITIHHLEKSRSQRIIWLLEELEVPYEIRHYERDPETDLAPNALIEVHPLGKAPVVTDGDRTIAESGAIIEYLVGAYDKDGRLRPQDGTPERLRYVYWLHYAEGTIAPLMVLSLIMRRIEEAPVPFFLKPVTRGIANKVRDGYLTATVQRNLDFMEKTLDESTWVAGDDFSAADIQMSFPVQAAAARLDLGNDYPALAGFIERISARPAYRRAVEKGGSFELLS